MNADELNEAAQAYLALASECHWCGCNLTEETGIHMDHVIPVSLGGSDENENLVPACQSCNLRKAAKLPWEWLPDKPNLWAFWKDVWDEGPPLIWSAGRGL